MGRVNTPILTAEERKVLENEIKMNDNHAFRARCHVILLKAAKRKSKDVGQIVGMCHVSVNAWLKRYKQTGLAGLKTRPGRGRKPAIHKATEETAIREAVEANRQRIMHAKAEWEAQRPADRKAVGRDTFRTFLKALVGDINESAGG